MTNFMRVSCRETISFPNPPNPQPPIRKAAGMHPTGMLSCTFYTLIYIYIYACAHDTVMGGVLINLALIYNKNALSSPVQIRDDNKCSPIFKFMIIRT